MRYGNLGNALDWAAHWRSHGGFVTSRPGITDVACFQPFTDGADAVYGHVAVVTAISGVFFTVSEMNGPAGPGRTDDRVCRLASGVSFLAQFAPTPPIPLSPGGPPMWLYQAVSGTVYLVAGNTLVPLGSGSDIKLFMSKGAPLVVQTSLTAEAQAEIAKLPRTP
jgi:surface antigen